MSPFGRIFCFISAGKVVTFPHQSTSLLLFDVFFFPLDKDKSEDLFYMLLNSTDTENEKKALLNFFKVFCL